MTLNLYGNYYFVISALFGLSLTSPLMAQTGAYQPPNLRTEIFGGFSLAPISPGRAADKNLDRVTLGGWSASATTYQFFPRWGLTAEFSGNYGTPSIANRVPGTNNFELDARQHTALFGGTYRALQRRRFALTGRIRAGVTRWEPKSDTAAAAALLISNGIFPKQNAFTFAFGQSIDVKLSEELAVRIQPDLRFVRMRENDNSRRLLLQQSFSFGLVYKFGK